MRVWREAGRRIALVPTRGTLHKGHMRLVAEAQERADHVIVSRCREPAAARAPMLEADRDLLLKMGATLAFAPPQQGNHPRGRELAAAVTVPWLADMLEGAKRSRGISRIWQHHAAHQAHQSHQAGDVALFGERDFQRLSIVRRVVDDLFLRGRNSGLQHLARQRRAGGLLLSIEA